LQGSLTDPMPDECLGLACVRSKGAAKLETYLTSGRIEWCMMAGLGAEWWGYLGEPTVVLLWLYNLAAVVL